MSISQNEGVQAAAKAAAAFEPRQQDKKQVEEKQYDKPEEKSLSAPDSKPYVVNLTDAAVKRSGDTQESYTGERGSGTGNGSQAGYLESGRLKSTVTSATDEAVYRADSGQVVKEPGPAGRIKSSLVEAPEPQNSFVEAGTVRQDAHSATDEAAARAKLGVPANSPGAVENEKSAQVKKPEITNAFVEAGSVEQEVASATDEAAERAVKGEVAKDAGVGLETKKSTQVKKPEIANAFVEAGSVEQEVTSATDEAAERAAAGAPAGAESDIAETGAAGVEALAKGVEGGLKDPGTAQVKPESTEAEPAAVGSAEKAKEPEALERAGTVAKPVDKRSTEPVDKQDQAGELRKSISVYA